jgi:hypothetical protein
MDTERWNRVDSLLQSALDRPEAERDAYLRNACGGDQRLEEEVRSLLAAHDGADGFLGARAIDLAARELARERSDGGRLAGSSTVLALFSTVGESALARQSLLKAYQLRHRASNVERFYTDTLYDRDVTSIPWTRWRACNWHEHSRSRADTVKAKTAYSDLFELWKAADADIPIVKAARDEYARLQ